MDRKERQEQFLKNATPDQMAQILEAVNSIQLTQEDIKNEASANVFFEKWSGRIGENATYNILSCVNLGECSQVLPFVNVFLERKEKELKSEPNGQTLAEALKLNFLPEANVSEPCAALVDAARSEALKFPNGKITTRPVKIVPYPMGKAGQALWKTAMIASKESGQITYGVPIKGNSKKMYCMAINFAGLKEKYGIPEDCELTQYDKRVFVAVHALFYAGNSYMTLSMIHSAMGNTSRPSPEQLHKIRISLYKMKGELYFDNVQEIQVYKKYEHHPYRGEILQYEFIDGFGIVNNKASEMVIRVLDASFIYRFDTATERKHFTSIKPSLLETDLQQTEENLALEDFWIITIANIINKRRVNKVLFDSIFSECGITRNKNRAIDRSETILELHKRKMRITSYSIDREKKEIVIHVPRKK